MLSRSRHAKFFRLALYAALLAYVSVLFAAYTRLSQAGLGCPDWPGCYGKLFAPLTAQDLQAAPLEPPKPEDRAWKEMVQRYIAGAMGLMMIRLAALGWRLKKHKRSQQVLIPATVLVLVFALTLAGLLTMGKQFKPLVMMMQLLGGMTILALLWWIAMREQRFWRSVAPSRTARSLRPRVVIALALVAFQIVLGGWSMVNYAGLACPDFPTCQGVWWPEMDFLDAFALWRDVGLDYEGGLLNLLGATAVHMAHRVGALITLLYVGWLALRVLRVGFEESLCRYGMLVLAILLAESALGVVEVVAHLPLAVAVAHHGMAALLLLSLVTLYHVVRPPRTP
ncbi:MAG: hypothetical protein A2151_00270 [Candidatus Muproteobacteria bacterium RBG_16_65_34]|uniref:Cytochrome C oxidase subunit I n=1 Tax=Candidatus Muproteobacteria bacterium RBG_16_65_34 TaxID=1817760 RepID=A0A1F6TUN5_9PROT|nr:MAG: hypothetical protein A2151_00270 [Candidatus Muproteobacteria bacterium RBG_16_65_34]